MLQSRRSVVLKDGDMRIMWVEQRTKFPRKRKELGNVSVVLFPYPVS